MRRTPNNRTDREVAKAIALQLPDVELGSHHGTMDIRVRNKIFATFPAEGKVVVLRCRPEDLDHLTKRSPETFSKAWGDTWVKVALDQIDRAMLRTLLVDSWMLAALPALRRFHEGQLHNRIR
jgi:predicted DNA-binding protein (MmcQ/YjbR family)